MRNSLLSICAVLALGLTFGGFAQEDTPIDNAEDNVPVTAEPVETDPWKPEIMQDGRFIQVGEFSIENPYAQRGSKLLSGDQRKQLWRSFMHGVTDLRGYPVPWQALDTTPFTIPLDANELITLPYKKSNLLSACVAGGTSVTFPKSMIAPDLLFANRGKTIRVFVWIRGVDTGKESDLYSGCPGLNLSLVDGTGSEIASAAPLFKTRGTFPWFCYHLDITIPHTFVRLQENGESAGENAEPAEGAEASEETAPAEGSTESEEDTALRQLAQQLIGIQDEESDEKADTRKPGLYVTLSNPVSGKAWFSTLSWQVIKADETILSPSAKLTALDPVTGSYAPNPDHDELPMHLIFGIAKQAKWNFLNGTDAMPSLLRRENLQECLQAGRNDWLFMLHALPYLYSLNFNGKLLGNAGEFGAGWEETLIEYLNREQSTTTGLWEINGTPNLFVSNAIIKNSFSYQAPAYSDWIPSQTPWLGSELYKLAHADLIIDTVVSAQKMHNRTAAGWNNCAFNDILKDTPQNAVLCDLPATAAAAGILRYAAAYASDEKAAKAQLAIAQAWRFVMGGMIMRNGLWKTSTGGGFRANQASLFDFLEETSWLSFRTTSTIPAPQATLSLDESYNLTISWKPTAPAVALRIFVASNEVRAEELNETHLAAIIQPPSRSYTAKDPLLLLRELAATGAKNWGISFAANGNLYLDHKLQGIPKKLKVFTKTQNQKLALKQAKLKQLIHVAAVSPYGEMSEIITISDTIPALEGAEEETAANE